MKVLMLGWEFPPFISGGLGTACYGLTRALSERGTEILFVLPRTVAQTQASQAGRVRLLSAEQTPASQQWTLEGLERVRLLAVSAGLTPYDTAQTYHLRLAEAGLLKEGADVPMASILGPLSTGLFSAHYAGDLIGEVNRYADLVVNLARGLEFDVIHAHDWMTYPAALAISAISGKPLVVHIHSTEIDRSGININQQIYEIERKGLNEADRVICVSNRTKGIVTEHYGVAEDKIRVIYNALTTNGDSLPAQSAAAAKRDKIVLFLGRITMQKGPEYFIAAAKKVLDVIGNVKFVMAGSGDMARRMIDLAAQLGIGHRVLFAGFLSADEVRRMFQMADLYVMPSVSEPFGITPLEAMASDVPVMISKQSGVSEVITHVLKVDFWDVNEMANKIIAVLRHPPLQLTLRRNGASEVRKFRWADAAHACLDLYEDLLAARVAQARN